MHGMEGYNQSLSLDWLKAPVEHDRVSLLEFARGALYSLSASSDGRFREVHVSRIRNQFERLGVPNLYRVGLRLLELLREAESLFGGYWLPAPFRVVEIEGCPVFVGAVPTALGHVGNVVNQGLCRLLLPNVAVRFPRQDIDSWMGNPPTDPASLVASFIRAHTHKAVPTVYPAEIEYLDFAAIGAVASRRFVWVGRPSPVFADHRIAICRQRHGGAYRYFSADFRSGRVIAEAVIEQSIPRLMFALASQAAKPVLIRVRNGSNTEVTVAERLPIEEYRLALLLSREIVRHGSSSTFHLAPQLAPALIKRLIGLGCVLETCK